MPFDIFVREPGTFWGIEYATPPARYTRIATITNNVRVKQVIGELSAAPKFYIIWISSTMGLH